MLALQCKGVTSATCHNRPLDPAHTKVRSNLQDGRRDSALLVCLMPAVVLPSASWSRRHWISAAACGCRPAHAHHLGNHMCVGRLACC